MGRKLRFLLFACLFAWFAKDGKGQTVQIAPDCFFSAAYTVSANAVTAVNGTSTSNGRYPSAGFNNSTQGNCVAWSVTYSNSTPTGLTGLSLRFDSAPDSSGSPGTWATFASSACTPGGSIPCISIGVNPNTNATAAFTALLGYQKWVSLNLTGLTGTGTITVFAYGCRTTTCASLVNLAASGGAPSSSVNVTQINGTAPPALNGALGQMLACPNTAILNTSSSGNVQVIALSGSTTIYICDVMWASSASADVKLTQGTGSNCAGGTADLTGLLKAVSAFDHSFQGSLRSVAGDAVCFNQSAANTTGVTITYAQF